MNPVVALWMEQDAVFYTRGTTHHTRDAIVNAPACDPGDLGVAYGAGSALELPEKAKSPRSPKRSRHMISFAFFEVSFMGQIVGISGALDLNVSLNGRATGEQQSHFARFALVVTRLPKEGPVVPSVLLKVFLSEPAGRFCRVPSPGPLPQTNEDGAVNACKDAFTHHVPVIVGPTSYFGVEPIDQIGGGHAQRSFDVSADTIQKGLAILFGRLDEQFPVGILAHILSEKIKAFLHVCDDCLRGRKLQPSFVQKLLHEGLDFSFQ